MRRRTSIAITAVVALVLGALGAHAETPPAKRTPPPAPAPPTPPPLTNAGYLVVYSTPWARIHVDGKDTGKTTPISPRNRITLAAGLHKITFVVPTAGGDEKFTYTVTIKAGETLRLHKQLPVRGSPPTPVRLRTAHAPQAW